MVTVFIEVTKNGTKCLTCPNGTPVSYVREHFLGKDELFSGDFYILHQGKVALDEDVLENDTTYHLQPRLCGGKGGFGSMLRAIGAQIEKTTSREACRDLSGRRMRDVNNEKKLREWVAKQADREREKDQRRQERLERRRAEPRHKFDDPQYHKQKQLVAEGLEDALQAGLQKAGPSGTVSTVTSTRKRKAQTEKTSNSKMAREWLGVEDLSDFSSDSDEDSQSSSSLADQSVPDSGCDSSPDDLSQPGKAESTGDERSPQDSGIISVDETKSVVVKGSNMDHVALDKDSSSSDNNDDKCPPSIKDCQKEGDTGNLDDTESKSLKPSGHGLLMALSDVPTGQVIQLQNSENREEININPKTVEKEPHENKEETKKGDKLDLFEYNAAEELLVVGGDHLKAELMALGLKCGGTPAERAERLFSVRGLSKDQIDPKLFAKQSKGKKKKVPTATLR